jgi:hypothetical protein
LVWTFGNESYMLAGDLVTLLDAATMGCMYLSKSSCCWVSLIIGFACSRLLILREGVSKAGAG